jgi:hypothetical protein
VAWGLVHLGAGGLSMPRVLQGDKIYPWLVVVLLAGTFADIALILVLFWHPGKGIHSLRRSSGTEHFQGG